MGEHHSAVIATNEMSPEELAEDSEQHIVLSEDEDCELSIYQWSFSTANLKLQWNYLNPLVVCFGQ